ncbi:uncharacterized protein LOC125420972 [Ziziphus jujuba]|uniref:Uncharacterized protein LOC125420972 n=1 Tax=Ziziphus jujuba TaxID=326968 RepID=A0ABM3IAX6_ZIZJJ|nr:uncharacterized protein LOC125420972 [Ziziphus jujuba]
MKVGESVNEYFARTFTIANKIRVHGEKMEDIVIIEKILRSMTYKFDYVVCSIEESNDLDTLSIDMLQSSLLVHEQCMTGHLEDEQALKETETKAHYAEASGEMLLMAYVDVKEASKEELWFLDVGCSNHMYGKKEFFSRFDESFSISVKLGDNSSMAVIGKGNIQMIVNGIVQVITNIFYVPGLKNNLLSVGQLQEKGFAKM